MSSATPSLEDLLGKRADEIKPVLPLPVGTYRLEIKGTEPGVSSKKKTPYVRVLYKAVEPQGDIDPNDLPDEWAKRTIRDDFYLTDAAEMRLRRFFENSLNLDLTGRTIAEILPDLKGREVTAYIIQEPSEDPRSEAIYNNIERYVTEDED